MSWFKRGTSKDRPLSLDGERLSSESEAFLFGTLAEEIRRRGDGVPPWAWLNVFAHGDLGAIEQLSRTSGVGDTGFGDCDAELPWRSAQRTLAREIVALVLEDEYLLARIQQAVLVPLELQLTRAEAERGLSAVDLVVATRSALRSSIA